MDKGIVREPRRGAAAVNTAEYEEDRLDDEVQWPARSDDFSRTRVHSAENATERQADLIADHVLTTQKPSVVDDARPRAGPTSAGPARRDDAVPAAAAKVIDQPGTPLPRPLQRDMEHRLGQDFSHVRVHSGNAAAQSARAMNAQAYTVGRDIVFGAGRFAPGTRDGQHLLAHELTHVVQQMTAGSATVQRKEVPGQHQWATLITQITVEAYSRGKASALTSGGQRIAVTVEVNRLNVGKYETGSHESLHGDKPDAESWTRVHWSRAEKTNNFVYLLPPGVLPAESLTIVVKPQSKTTRAKATIKSLQPHVHDFLIARGKEPSEKEMHSIANAGRILEQAGVTEEELMLERQRRIDWEGIGKTDGESTDLETWARDYVAHRRHEMAAARTGAANFLELAKRISHAPPEVIKYVRGMGIIQVMEPDSDRFARALDTNRCD